MSQLKSWSSTADGNSLMPHGSRTRTSNALMAANNRARSEVNMNPGTSLDKRGQALRLLRLQQQVDPAELATQACISLRQLFQLETGATSLFYSDSLRNQAGRRVAGLLGTDWDQLSTSHAGPATSIEPVLAPSSSAAQQ